MWTPRGPFLGPTWAPLCCQRSPRMKDMKNFPLSQFLYTCSDILFFLLLIKIKKSSMGSPEALRGPLTPWGAKNIFSIFFIILQFKTFKDFYTKFWDFLDHLRAQRGPMGTKGLGWANFSSRIS